MRWFSISVGVSLLVSSWMGCDANSEVCDPSLAGVNAAGCQSLQCMGSMADCKNGAVDGCETNTATDLSNCGACGVKCPKPAVGEAVCVGGICGVAACGVRFQDCNKDTADSCESDTQRDPNNCGACGKVCQGGANAVGVCIRGECQIACQGAFLDCNSNVGDGCEVNGTNDISNCGNCGNACRSSGATTPACDAGSCINTACTGSRRTCVAGPVDGCETDILTSSAHCGACGRNCGAGTCVNGKCGCATNPQWMPVTCTTGSWVWSSNRAAAPTLATANAQRFLQTGCNHSGVPGDSQGRCSLTGTGWVSTQTFTMAGCDASWIHLAPGNSTFNCGGHDGDTYRHLALGPDDCYAY